VILLLRTGAKIDHLHGKRRMCAIGSRPGLDLARLILNMKNEKKGMIHSARNN